MKIDMNIISVILVMLTFFPYFLIPYLQYRLNKRLKLKFEQEAENHKLNLDIMDRWNLNLIGIDLKKNKLLFVQSTNNIFCVEIIDLSKVRDCVVNPQLFRYKSKGKEEDILKRVDLEFSSGFYDEKIVLNLYDCDVNYAQDLEMRHAEKWCNIIHGQISAKSVLKPTA